MHKEIILSLESLWDLANDIAESFYRNGIITEEERYKIFFPKELLIRTFIKRREEDKTIRIRNSFYCTFCKTFQGYLNEEDVALIFKMPLSEQPPPAAQYDKKIKSGFLEYVRHNRKKLSFIPDQKSQIDALLVFFGKFFSVLQNHHLFKAKENVRGRVLGKCRKREIVFAKLSLTTLTMQTFIDEKYSFYARHLNADRVTVLRRSAAHRNLINTKNRSDRAVEYQIFFSEIQKALN